VVLIIGDRFRVRCALASMVAIVPRYCWSPWGNAQQLIDPWNDYAFFETNSRRSSRAVLLLIGGFLRSSQERSSGTSISSVSSPPRGIRARLGYLIVDVELFICSISFVDLDRNDGSVVV
jgi:hypothetical protein